MSAPYYEDERVMLYHGKALDVLREQPTDSVDAVLTDPPYKLSQEYGSTTDPDNLLAVSSLWPVAPEMLRVAKPGSLCAMFYDTRILPLALAAMTDAGWKYLRAVTLYRRWGQASLLNGWMTTSDFVLIFAKPGAKHVFHGKPKHDVYIRDKPELDSFGHPAQKPLEHTRHLLSNITPRGGLVLDPYMGSGTTGVAAFIEGATFLGVESAAHWVTVARDRILSTAPEIAARRLAQDTLFGGDVA